MNIDTNNTSIYTNTNFNHLPTEDNLFSFLLLNNNSLEGVPYEETQTPSPLEDISTKAALSLLNNNNNNLEMETVAEPNQPPPSQEEMSLVAFQQLLQQSLEIQKTLREENAQLELKITQQQEIVDSLIQKTRMITVENKNLRAVLNLAITTPAIKQSTNTTTRMTDSSSLSNNAISTTTTSNYWLLNNENTPNKNNTGAHLANFMVPSSNSTITTTTDVSMEPVTQGVESRQSSTTYTSPHTHNKQSSSSGRIGIAPWFEKRVSLGNDDSSSVKESFSHSSYEFVQHNTQEIQAWINAYHSSKSKKKRKYTRRNSQHK